MSSTRLIRKVSQFRVQSFYVIPTAHTYMSVCVCACARARVCVCVCVCAGKHMRATHETSTFYIIFKGYSYRHETAMLMTM